MEKYLMDKQQYYTNLIIELYDEHIKNLWVARRLVKATYLGRSWCDRSIMDKFRTDIQYLIKEKRDFLRKIKKMEENNES